MTSAYSIPHLDAGYFVKSLERHSKCFERLSLVIFLVCGADLEL